MNLLRFFTPKSELVYLLDNFTIRQAMEKMERCHYTALPILDSDNHYVGTITEGDVLRYLKSQNLSGVKDTEKLFISDVPKQLSTQCVKINTPLDELISLFENQIFIPVSDDRKKFMGIVTRQKIIEYLYKIAFSEA